MADTDLCTMSAVEAAARFRDGSLSPVEVMEAMVARAEAVEPRVNAFAYRHFDSAMEQARAAEAAFRTSGARLRPLTGLPVAVKDSTEIAGMPNSCGSVPLKDRLATHTSFVNARVLDAGGIVHARTTTPEFSCSATCHSKLWGVTRNPWNPDFTCGGSSGGSGASLAAGTSSLATGSDIAGSIRIPASCCGVVGYKPPYGRNPQDPPLNLDFYCHAGPMARTVADTILLQNVMSGPNPGDIAALPEDVAVVAKPRAMRGTRIAACLTLGFYALDPEVEANARASLEIFRDLGAIVEEVGLPWGADVLEAARAHLTHVFGASLAPMLDAHEAEMTGYAAQFARDGRASRAGDHLRGLETVGRMWEDFGALMQRFDLFVCPTTALPAVPAEFDHSRDRLRIAGVEVDPFLGWVMTPAFNMLSRCPVLSLPSGRARDGVPTGIQLVGRAYDDQGVFGAGLAFERAAGLWATDGTWPMAAPVLECGAVQ